MLAGRLEEGFQLLRAKVGDEAGLASKIKAKNDSSTTPAVEKNGSYWSKFLYPENVA